ncbi:hypothetical protein [Merismopedia glauca]|uniref:SPOR domain-containing protein n=1 Tax=Merismopedia glauca CCAP 1448/3 TaxID=1296344 RepID=A0A2T1BZ63_9CYAN|nr:hypothetical protein [Merismopedia glauca]PSB01291.1 hypothetical protein C7B64_19045 [Merismopedia glauca CCAP 1448/3]
MRIATLCILLGIICVKSNVADAVPTPSLSVCQPPTKGDYLVLVVSPTQANQETIRRALPLQLKMIVCRYSKDVVVRVEGFKNITEANQQAQNLRKLVKTPIAIAVPPTPAKTNLSNYRPLPLPKGYAVLVNYNNQPKIATKLRQFIGKKVGLVSYRQHPYLLASNFSNQAQAKTLQKRLQSHGFKTILIDSTKAILLRQEIQF